MLIERLSKESGLGASRLQYFASSASKRYFVFSIPKATGGTREIAHPSRPLKSVQRWLNNQYLLHLPVHPAAMAYRKGVSIRDNATRHAAFRFTVRIDFRDFFPSFNTEQVVAFLEGEKDRIRINSEDTRFVGSLVSRHGGLTIGAPTSPVLTNAMMYRFDTALFEFTRVNAMVYTRYADDIFISTDAPNTLSSAYNFVRDQCALFPFSDLRINTKKTAFLSRRYRREITGLVITPDKKVSLGRKRKREIKSLIFKSIQGDVPQDRLEYLKGLISFASDVEPSFISSLADKYGEDFWWVLQQRYKPLPTSFAKLEDLDPQPKPA